MIVPAVAAGICMQGLDYIWLSPAVFETAKNLIAFRPGMTATLATFYPLAGISAARWAWVITGFWAVGGGVVGVLGRSLGLSWRWTATSALMAFAAPAIVDGLRIAYLAEFALTAAFLTVVLAYLRRTRASTPRERNVWLAIEAAAVVMGVGFKESFLIYPGLLLSLEAGWLLPAEQGSWRKLAGGMLRRLRPHALLFPLACVWGIRQGLSALSSREVTFAASNVLDQAGWLLSGAAVPQLAGWLGHRAAGAVVLALLVLAIVRAPRRPSIQRTAALCALVVTLPMLWLEHRMFPGYLVQPWPWIALTAVGAMSESRSWISRTLWLGWVGMWFVSSPVLREHQSCTLNEETLASLRSQEAAACERDWPVWHTTAPVTKRAYVEEATRGKLEMYRLWCGKQEVMLELE